MKKIVSITLVLILSLTTTCAHPVQKKQTEFNYLIFNSLEENLNINEVLESYNSGKMLYFYNNVKMEVLKDWLKLENEAFIKPIVDENGAIIENNFYTINETTSYDIIGIGKNQNIYIANIPDECLSDVGFIERQIEQYENRKAKNNYSATLVSKGFDIESSDKYGNIATLDYYIYRENDEEDSSYDYYALKTNVQVTTSKSRPQAPYGVFVEHSKDYPDDELVDYGPGSSENQTSISGNVGFGEVGTASVSFAMSFSNAPSIKASSSLASDYVNWELSSIYPLTEKFQSVSSWAVTSSEGCSIKVEFYGKIKPQSGAVTITDPLSFSVIYLK